MPLRHLAVLAVAALLSVPSAAQQAAPPTDDLVREVGRIGALTVASGRPGTFDAADLDGDGRPEILGVAGGGLGYASPGYHVWYVLSADGRGGYAVRWVSDVVTWDNEDAGGDGGITALRARDTDGDGRPEVVVLSASGDVRVYDGRTRALLRLASIQRPIFQSVYYPPAWSMAFGDADNDGAEELVVATAESIYLLDPATLRVELAYRYDLASDHRHGDATDVAVGDVDGDGDQEVVLASGLVLGVRGGAVAVEWDLPSTDYGDAAFGHRLHLVDVDGDGRSEIAALGIWSGFRLFDAVRQAVVWAPAVPEATRGRDFYAGDADGDGRVDLVLAESYYDTVTGATSPMARYVYDRAAGAFALVWRTPYLNEEEDYSGGIDRGFLVRDLDGDGRVEVFGASSPLQTGPQPAYTFDFATGERSWRSDHPDGPFYAVAVGDTDGDGRDELVFASATTRVGREGQLFVYDVASRRELWRSRTGWLGRRNAGGETVYHGMWGVAVGDVDGDGTAEIVVAADSVGTGALYVLDGPTREVERIHYLDDATPLRSVALADLDGDGTPEIVVGSTTATTASPGLFAYAVDGRTGRVLWRVGRERRAYYDRVYDDVIESVSVGDVTGDGVPDVAFVEKPAGTVTVVDGATRATATAFDPMIQGADLADLDGDGVSEVVVGVLNRIDAPVGTGFVSVYAWRGGALVRTEDHAVQSTVQAVAVADLDGAGRPEVVWSDLYDGPVGYWLDDRRVVWRSGTGLFVSGDVEPVVADPDGDGQADVFWGAAYAVYHYESTRGSAAVATAGAPDADRPALALWPNPSRGPLTLAFHLDVPAPVSAEVVDALGRTVARFDLGARPPGAHTATWDPGLAAGAYVLRLRAGDRVWSHPLVRAR